MALSQRALQAVLASATDKVFLECLKISHSEMTNIFLVNDTQDLIRSEAIFQRFPFKVSAATQNGDRPPAINITADAVDQRIVQGVRQLAGSRERAKIKYEIVLADQPDSIEFGPVEFEFDSMTGSSATQITLRASFLKGALNDAFPALQFAPSNVAR